MPKPNEKRKYPVVFTITMYDTREALATFANAAAMHPGTEYVEVDDGRVSDTAMKQWKDLTGEDDPIGWDCD